MLNPRIARLLDFVPFSRFPDFPDPDRRARWTATIASRIRSLQFPVVSLFSRSPTTATLFAIGHHSSLAVCGIEDLAVWVL